MPQGRCWLAVDLLRLLDDEVWLYKLREVSELISIPLVVTRTQEGLGQPKKQPV